MTLKASQPKSSLSGTWTTWENPEAVVPVATSCKALGGWRTVWYLSVYYLCSPPTSKSLSQLPGKVCVKGGVKPSCRGPVPTCDLLGTRAAQQEVSSASCPRPPPPRSMENLSSTKPVSGALKVGDRHVIGTAENQKRKALEEAEGPQDREAGTCANADEGLGSDDVTEPWWSARFLGSLAICRCCL